ncbi:MAG: glycosyltransferase [Planctomycetes bacterium]|nr:glycosyltransferase [Planctomycetota bacterium]
MRILFVTMQYGRGYSQGTERYLSLLSAAMRARGHETLFLAGDPERRGPAARLGEVVQDSPRVLALPTRGWMAVNGEPVAAIRALLDRERPDLVQLANPGHIGLNVIDAAREAGLPVVISVVDFWWLCPKHTLHHHSGGMCDAAVRPAECRRCIARTHERPIVRALDRVPLAGRAVLPLMMLEKALTGGTTFGELRAWPHRRSRTREALEKADAVICLSATAQRLLSTAAPAARMTVIRNGLEDGWFSPPATPRRPKPTQPDLLVIGYAGAIAPHKGVHLLPAALRMLGGTQARLRIASAAESPAYAAQLRRECAGLTAEFVGRVSPDAMPAFLDSLDLLVVPSVWPENVPMTILEAFARRTPVIASDMPGIAELFDGKSCLFESGSAAALAECLRRWLAAPEIAPPRARNAAETCAETLAVYEAAMERASQRASM